MINRLMKIIAIKCSTIQHGLCNYTTLQNLDRDFIHVHLCKAVDLLL